MGGAEQTHRPAQIVGFPGGLRNGYRPGEIGARPCVRSDLQRHPRAPSLEDSSTTAASLSGPGLEEGEGRLFRRPATLVCQCCDMAAGGPVLRSEEHTSELQSLMR